MSVAALLKSKGGSVVMTRPGATVRQAIERMTGDGIGALVVAKPVHADIAGIISERDIVRALAKHGAATLEMPVADIMSRNVRTCAPGDSVRHVMKVMTRSRSRHLPVMDGGRLCGIVSIGDVVKHRLRDMELEMGVLRDVCTFGGNRVALRS